MQRKRVIFSGQVQGVGFRATARSIAGGFTVTGWVSNEHDGTVMLEVQGQPAQVDGFLSALRTRMGRLISAEEVVPTRPIEGETSFEIRH